MKNKKAKKSKRTLVVLVLEPVYIEHTSKKEVIEKLTETLEACGYSSVMEISKK